MSYIQEYSEGEIFIAEFLKEKKIKYCFQKKISNLKGDSKSFREADFYLPRYKIYIEFFGLWNVSEKNKQGYIEKWRVYKENHIPCIYIYPENLGILDHTFEYRIRDVLKNNMMNRELFLFNCHQLMGDKGDAFFLLFISIICLAFGNYKVNPENNWIYILFFTGAIFYQVYRIIKGYRRFFMNDRSLKTPDHK